MFTVNGWILHLIFSPFVVSRTVSLHNPLSFTLAYHTLHTYGRSLIVKVCALAVCSPPGSAYVPLLDLLLCTGQNGLPWTYMHPTLCTLDAVTAYAQVTLLFPLGVWLWKFRRKNVGLFRWSHYMQLFSSFYSSYMCVDFPSLVPRPSITANAVEGLVKVRRMTDVLW